MSARLPHKGLPVTIEADAEQRAALAEAHGLVSVESLRAELLVTPLEAQWRQGRAARVEADIVQACVVTLEPVAAQIDEDGRRGCSCRRIRSSARQGFDDGGEIMLDADGPDSPGNLFRRHHRCRRAGRRIFRRWRIDPYPRKPGASTCQAGSTRPPTSRRERISAKAALAAWTKAEWRQRPVRRNVGCAQTQNRYFRRSFAGARRRANSEMNIA